MSLAWHVTTTNAFKAASRQNHFLVSPPPFKYFFCTPALAHALSYSPTLTQVMSTVPSNLTVSPASTPSKKVGDHSPAGSAALLTNDLPNRLLLL